MQPSHQAGTALAEQIDHWCCLCPLGTLPRVLPLAAHTGVLPLPFSLSLPVSPRPTTPATPPRLARRRRLQPVFAINASQVVSLPTTGGMCTSQFSTSVYNTASDFKESINVA